MTSKHLVQISFLENL